MAGCPGPCMAGSLSLFFTLKLRADSAGLFCFSAPFSLLSVASSPFSSYICRREAKGHLAAASGITQNPSKPNATASLPYPPPCPPSTSPLLLPFFPFFPLSLSTSSLPFYLPLPFPSFNLRPSLFPFLPALSRSFCPPLSGRAGWGFVFFVACYISARPCDPMTNARVTKGITLQRETRRVLLYRL